MPSDSASATSAAQEIPKSTVMSIFPRPVLKKIPQGSQFSEPSKARPINFRQAFVRKRAAMFFQACSFFFFFNAPSLRCGVLVFFPQRQRFFGGFGLVVAENPGVTADEFVNVFFESNLFAVSVKSKSSLNLLRLWSLYKKVPPLKGGPCV